MISLLKVPCSQRSMNQWFALLSMVSELRTRYEAIVRLYVFQHNNTKSNKERVGGSSDDDDDQEEEEEEEETEPVVEVAVVQPPASA